jgi:hypothetical protein
MWHNCNTISATKVVEVYNTALPGSTRAFSDVLLGCFLAVKDRTLNTSDFYNRVRRPGRKIIPCESVKSGFAQVGFALPDGRR